MSRKRPTIVDVAKAADVSIGTVSNYLNGTAGIRLATRKRIEAAIDSLAYRPSAVARSLSGWALIRGPENHLSLPRLLVVGYISVDYLCRVEVLPHRDDRITARHIEKALGGPAANLAVAAAGVGAPHGLDVELATALGNDPDSDWALTALSHRGVHALPIRPPFNDRLSRCIVIIEANGSRTIINEPFELSEVDLTANLEIKPETRPACLHIEGYHYERMIGSIERFRQAGWKTSLHSTGLPAGSRRPDSFMELVCNIDLVFVNDVMLREIFAIRSPIATIIQHLNEVLSGCQPRADVVLTLGEHGAVIFPRDGAAPIEVPALPVELIDATGAGDAFAGVFLCFWLHGASLIDAARHAAVAGSLATTAEGAQGRVSTFVDLDAALAGMTPAASA